MLLIACRRIAVESYPGMYSLREVRAIIIKVAPIKRIAETLTIMKTLNRLSLYDSISSKVFSLRTTKRYFAKILARNDFLSLLFDLAIVCKYNQLCFGVSESSKNFITFV